MGNDGYWEGTLTSNPGQFDWFEPDLDDTTPLWAWPANGGVIIAAGQVK